MDKIKVLQLKKLLKELDFIETDYEYRSEIVSEADNEFIKSINDFLTQHPDIKKNYDEKLNEIINKSIKKSQEIEKRVHPIDEDISSESQSEESTDIKENDEVVESKEDLSALRKMYREIAKLTHPDKIKKKYYNDLYIKATEYYDKSNKIGLYKICNELGIDYELENGDEDLISYRISELRQKIGFLETTFAWKWFTTESPEEKNQILIQYIKLRIST